MKIYSIAIKNKNSYYWGTPVLTSERHKALNLKKEWEKQISKKNTVEITVYEVKTQGINSGNYAFAERFIP